MRLYKKPIKLIWEDKFDNTFKHGYAIGLVEQLIPWNPGKSWFYFFIKYEGGYALIDQELILSGRIP